MEDYVILVLGLTMTVILGIIGVNWVRSRGVEPEYVNKKLKLYKENIEELEIEVKHWKGKYHQKSQLPTVEGEYNLSDKSSVQSLIQEILPSISGILPKDLQGLAKDPKIVEYAMKLYEENPEQAKNLFNKFLRKGKIGSISTQEQQITAL